MNKLKNSHKLSFKVLVVPAQVTYHETLSLQDTLLGLRLTFRSQPPRRPVTAHYFFYSGTREGRRFYAQALHPQFTPAPRSIIVAQENTQGTEGTSIPPSATFC